MVQAQQVRPESPEGASPLTEGTTHVFLVEPKILLADTKDRT